MRVPIQVRFTIDEAIADLHGTPSPAWLDGILAVKIEDRLFVGGGCEAQAHDTPELSSGPLPQYLTRHQGQVEANIAICSCRHTKSAP